MAVFSFEIIKKDVDFRDIFQTGKTVIGRFIFLKIKKTKGSGPRFAVVAGLKVSKKAVQRNKIKRRIRAIISKTHPKILSGYDIVVIAKKEAVTEKFKTLQEDLIKTLEKAKVFK